MKKSIINYLKTKTKTHKAIIKELDRMEEIIKTIISIQAEQNIILEEYKNNSYKTKYLEEHKKYKELLKKYKEEK
ncbi:MAG: hypothetical protein VZS44_09355 [Bacilli bacterium]|nr:hypothetical protein [Bacilli bacterium]